MVDLSKIKVLTWDIGGTVFDWRGTVEARSFRTHKNKKNDLNH
jgi:FMN phosphatase YigB (HAD superfamily)